MADALSAVSPDVAARTKAILEAVASGGTAGLKSYEQSQQALTQSKTDAVTRAQQRAALIGGPEAQGVEAQSAQTYDRGIANMGTARTGFEGHMATLGTAHKNYLDQVSAAVPLVRADTERQIAVKQQALQAALAEKNAEKDDKYMASDALGAAELTQSNVNSELSKATADRDKAVTDRDSKVAPLQKAYDEAGAAEADLTKKYLANEKKLHQYGNMNISDKVLKRLASEQAQMKSSLDNVRFAREGAKRQIDELNKGGSIAADQEKRVVELQTMANRPLHEVAREIAVRGGVDKTRAAGLINASDSLSRATATTNLSEAGASADVKNVAKWADTDLPTAATIISDESYLTTRNYGYAWADPGQYDLDDKGKLTGEGEKYDGLTPWQAFLVDISANLGQDKTATKKAIVNELEPLFQKSGLTTGRK